MERKAMSEMLELTDTGLEVVAGGVSDLGAYITQAVDNAISAATRGNPGNGPGVPGVYHPYKPPPGHLNNY
jgi:hypothetical protein